MCCFGCCGNALDRAAIERISEVVITPKNKEAIAIASHEEDVSQTK
jgi:hypothetical protein